MTLDHVPGAVKASADVVSVGVAVGTIAQLLPHVAAILTILWTAIRIYETDTVQSLIRRSPRLPATPADIDPDQHRG